MAMVINHNLSALNTFNKLNANNSLMNKSLEKLSSGYAINTASDDAAGLAISEKMRGQIRGLDQASDNAQDSISMVQTAEGALDETTEILQRMRELAVQSSSDTLTADDRSNIQDEIDALVTEITRIADTTEFNTKKLLDGSMSTAVASTANVQTNTALSAGAGTQATEATALTALTDTAGNSLGIQVSNATTTSVVTVSYIKDGALVSNAVTVSATTTAISDLDNTDFTFDTDADGNLIATAAAGGTAAAIYGLTITVETTDVASGTVTTNSKATNALSAFTQTVAGRDASVAGTATVLIGANTGQNIDISIGKMDAASLGVANLDVSSQEAADVAISAIDTATATVSTQRSQLGAVANRLEHTINNLSTSSENLTSAESNIRDVDMASEMANYTKLSVLNQAATAMLAKANAQPQQVLTLLQG